MKEPKEFKIAKRALKHGFYSLDDTLKDKMEKYNTLEKEAYEESYWYDLGVSRKKTIELLKEGDILLKRNELLSEIVIEISRKKTLSDLEKLGLALFCGMRIGKKKMDRLGSALLERLYQNI